MDLLTLEVQSCGEESMVGAKVVEHVAAGPVNVTCSSVPVPQPPAAAAAAATAGAVMGPPVRPPQPVQPATPVLTSNTIIQPSKEMFSYSSSDTS